MPPQPFQREQLKSLVWSVVQRLLRTGNFSPNSPTSLLVSSFSSIS